MKKLWIFFIVIGLCLSSCAEKVEDVEPSYQHGISSIYMTVMHIEYTIKMGDYKLAFELTQDLDAEFRAYYNLFCAEESAKIDAVRFVNHLLSHEVQKSSLQASLRELRILKSILAHIESETAADPYIIDLWTFEEDMHLATEIAMDPMLGLYDYPEFEEYVDCMITSWNRLKGRQPLYVHDYRNESLSHTPSTKKIVLEKAVLQFYKAVESADWEKYDLCNHAEVVREVYLDYIRTFINPYTDVNTTLAII